MQGIRTLAFIGIFLSHTGIECFSSLGPWGVSVFLLLSGFLMEINYADRELKVSFVYGLSFSMQKIKKLYPLHIVTMIMALPFSIGLEFRQILLNIGLNSLIMQSYVPVSKVYYSLNSVSWYLPVCFLAYAVFPFVLRMVKNHISGTKCAIIYLGILITVQILLCWIPSVFDIRIGDGFTKWFVYVFPGMRCIEFLCGCLLGHIFKSKDNRRCSNTDIVVLLSFTFLIIACIVFTLFNPHGSDLEYPSLWWRYTCIFTLLNGIMIYTVSLNHNTICKLLSQKCFVFIGNLSAYAFLIHQLVIRYSNLFWGRIGLNSGVGKFLVIPLEFTISICLSWLWGMINKKFNNMKSE